MKGKDQVESKKKKKNKEKKEKHETKKDRAKPTTSRVGTAIEALAGTALAFVVELVRMRRRKLQ